MVLIIDNYDSFTWNLVQYLRELGAEVVVHRNDQISIPEVRALAPQRIVISPGPCTPDEAGISMQLVRELGPKTPLLGVCLGHQCIGQAFGARVGRAARVMHGKTSAIHHDGTGVFNGLANPMQATRYHSLVVDPDTLPDCLEATAWARDADGQPQEVMGCRHRQWPIEGVQFHPESVFTPAGKALLHNFLQL